jgi:hypothetical protein
MNRLEKFLVEVSLAEAKGWPKENRIKKQCKKCPLFFMIHRKRKIDTNSIVEKLGKDAAGICMAPNIPEWLLPDNKPGRCQYYENLQRWPAAKL